jgi:hypothetical protein
MKGEPPAAEEGKSSLSLKTMAIKTLRDFRDNVLSKTPKGSSLIKLYYKYSSEVTGIINADPELKARAARALKELVKVMQGHISAASILDFEKHTIPAGLKDEISGLIDDIAEQGSEELRNAIEEARPLLLTQTINLLVDSFKLPSADLQAIIPGIFPAQVYPPRIFSKNVACLNLLENMGSDLIMLGQQPSLKALNLFS